MTALMMLTQSQVEALKVQAMYADKVTNGEATFPVETVLRLIVTIEVLADRLLREVHR